MSILRKWRMIVPVIGIMLFLGLLYIRSNDADESVYFENVALLRHIQQLDAQWDAEVLRSNIGLNSDYDPLVRPIAQLNNLLEQLDAIVAQQHGGHVDELELRALIRDLRASVEEKTRQIDRFKSHNAVLRNSLAFLPIAQDDVRLVILRDEADHELQRNSRRTVTEALLATLIYSQSASSEKRAEVNAQLDILTEFQSQLPAHIREQLTMFRAHIATVLREQDNVNESLQRITAVPTKIQAEKISKLLDSERRASSIKSYRHRNYLLLLSVVLAALLTYAAVRLLRNHRIINQVNKRLQDANETLEQRVQERTRELSSSYAMLHATFEATPDAVLAMQGDTVFYNSQYLQMWNISEEMLKNSEPLERVQWNARQTKEPEAYLQRIKEFGRLPADESFDMFEMQDGRFIERYIKPQRVDGKTVGLVVNFRDVSRRKRNEAELAKINEQLRQSSRQAGMAEVATGVLHNVGNVLNSVNVSANLVAENTKHSKVASLAKVAALLREQQDNLAQFVEHDPRGKHLVEFVAQLAEHLQAEQQLNIRELDSLRRSIDHIKEIVSMQQGYAKISGVVEPVNMIELVEDTLRMSDAALRRHGVTVLREFSAVPSINADKHKILQILVNLVTNAKRACTDSGRIDKRMTLRVSREADMIRVAVVDNGVGIPSENLIRIFAHGFTTRKDGHGFGLHSGALAARELGGTLTAHSQGSGLGATFVLDLPLRKQELAYGT